MDTRHSWVANDHGTGRRRGTVRFDQNGKQIIASTVTRKQSKELKLFGYKHIGRNDLCPCGSGKKFKKCCLVKLNVEITSNEKGV